MSAINDLICDVLALHDLDYRQQNIGGHTVVCTVCDVMMIVCAGNGGLVYVCGKVMG